jgi:hypothetical protein
MLMLKRLQVKTCWPCPGLHLPRLCRVLKRSSFFRPSSRSCLCRFRAELGPEKNNELDFSSNNLQGSY